MSRRRSSGAPFTRRYALTFRVLVAAVLSVAFLLVASEAFFSRAAFRELVQQEARGYVADARAVETAYQEGSDPADAIDDVLDLVDSMEDRLGVVSARVVDARDRVVDAPRDAHLGRDRGEEDVRHRGPSYADVRTREVGEWFEFTVPIHLNDERFLLQVNEDGQVLHGRIAALRNEALVFSFVSLLVGMGLFYVVGGRTLARRHSLAVERATRDALTNLGNHRSFRDELAHAIRVATRKRQPLALALIDLDQFKLINDLHGHRRGDEVLLEVARVLEGGRAGDRAFRIGGDEFALLLPGTDNATACAAVARRLAAARAGATAASFSAGVATLTVGHEEDATVLWEQADAALYEGKRSGGGEIVSFDDGAGLPAIVTPAKIEALGALLAEPRIETAFQPIWDIHQGRVIAFEALSRPWQGYGFDGPAEMFAVAEKIGRAHDLDTLCRAAALAGADDLPEAALLFLNVHPQSLAHGTLADDVLLRTVIAAGIDPQRIVLEITERSDARISQVVADASRLRSLGFRLALDDVGAGNAGLEILRQLPVDYVKIDRSVIVAAAAADTQARAVLLAIIAYASRADAYVIAEGIENHETLAFVRNADELHTLHDPSIKGGQGYLLGRPSPHIAQPSAELHQLCAA